MVWCRPVPTNTVVHGGLADPSDAMPVPVPNTHTHTHTSVIIKQRLTSGELIELQERPGSHPPTGLFYPHPVPLFSTQWGGSTRTHTHTLITHTHTHTHLHTLRPPPAEKTASVLCFYVIPLFSASPSYCSGDRSAVILLSFRSNKDISTRSERLSLNPTKTHTHTLTHSHAGTHTRAHAQTHTHTHTKHAKCSSHVESHTCLLC